MMLMGPLLLGATPLLLLLLLLPVLVFLARLPRPFLLLLLLPLLLRLPPRTAGTLKVTTEFSVASLLSSSVLSVNSRFNSAMHPCPCPAFALFSWLLWSWLWLWGTLLCL